MNCPNCTGQNLDLRHTNRGVDIDRCPNCGGIWLDKGEITALSKDADIDLAIEQAPIKSFLTQKYSPRAGEPMEEIEFPPGSRLYRCPQTRGLWIDADRMGILADAGVDMKLFGDGGDSSANPIQMKITPLLDLPNLLVRSVGSLAGLYMLLGLFLVSLVELQVLDALAALIIGFIVVVIQFVFGPWLMDLSLAWMFKCRDLRPDELPEYLGSFVQDICRKEGIKFPSFKLILDGAPQAFTYGHTPGNARIVISQGILDLLDPEEVKAVVAHEVGHALHWDMLLMTIAQLIPLIFYYLYKTLIRARTDRKNGGAIAMTALVSYLLYIVSQYVVLFLSRTREYYADRFSGFATGNPGALASALVGIAYGLAGRQAKTEEQGEGKRNPAFSAVSALGIFDEKAAQGLALCSFNNPGADQDLNNVKCAMRWDLWNPWAGWYELNSTHPLVAHRLLHLSNQAAAMGKEPYVLFDETRPESYWDEFLTDLAVKFLPLLLPLLVLGAFALTGNYDSMLLWPSLLAVFGLGLLINNEVYYPQKKFPEMSVAALMKQVKVSDVRPVPCTMRGTIIGRGVPGYIISEDMVLKDQTGIIFLDMRQPLGIWEIFLGAFVTPAFIGKEVEVTGWYRRHPVPYVQIKKIRREGLEKSSAVPLLNTFLSALVMLVGFAWLATVLANNLR